MHYRLGWFIDFNPGKEVTAFVKAEDKKIYINKGEGYEPFEIKGVNMGSGEPGQWSTDFAIDKETYLRWFKQMTGQSFTAYLNAYRLNAAAEALRTTDDTVLTVAERTGFKNLSYFNRAFKARFGQTPSEYRSGG